MAATIASASTSAIPTSSTSNPAISDPLRTALAPFLAANPDQAGPLYTVFNDLSLSVGWRDLSLVVLENTNWVVIIGHKRPEDPLRAVLPLPIHTTSLRPSSLSAIFSALRSLSLSTVTSISPPAASMEELRRVVEAQRRAHEAQRVAQGGKAVVVEGVEGESAEKRAEKIEVEPSTEVDRETWYMGITTPDSTVVYYKLSRGIKKPADIPDE